MDEQEIYRTAKKRANAKMGLCIHAAVYVVVNVLLVVINLSASPDNLWFVWPLAGWGLGLAFHAMAIYLFLDGGRIKDQMIRKELEKLSANGQSS